MSDTKNNDTAEEKGEIAVNIMSNDTKFTSPSKGDMDSIQFSPSSVESDESSVSSFDMDEFRNGLSNVIASSRYTMLRAA